MSKKTSRIGISFVIVILLIIIVPNVVSTLKKSNEFKETYNVSSYKTKTINFLSDIGICGLYLTYVGDDVQEYWYDTIYNKKFTSINKAINQALRDNKENLKNVEKCKKIVDTSYSELVKTDSEDNSEIIEIKSSIKNVYSDFYDLYLVVTDPSGSYNDFYNNYNDSYNKYSKSKNILVTLCSD